MEPKIHVEIEKSKPTPAQLKQWQELWRKLLQGQKQPTDNETEKAQQAVDCGATQARWTDKKVR